MNVTPYQLMKVIVRMSEIPEHHFQPEHALIFGIINQALEDLMYAFTSTRQHRNVKRFFSSELFQYYCDFVGLNPQSVRAFLKDCELI